MGHNAAAAGYAAHCSGVGRYQRHRPEHTLLYRVVEEYYPVFLAHLAERRIELPGYVQHEFDDYLQCGRLEHGFLRVRSESCHAEHLGGVQLHTPRLLSQLRRAALLVDAASVVLPRTVAILRFAAQDAAVLS